MSSVVIAEFPMTGVVVEWRKDDYYLIACRTSGECVTRSSLEQALVCGAKWAANIHKVANRDAETEKRGAYTIANNGV